MNTCILIGRLCKDPDIRYGQEDNSLAIARYSLAVDRPKRRNDNPNAQTADFISCIVFGKGAEFAEKYLHKGMKICVRGHIQTGSYTNKQNQKVYTTDVVVDDQEFCESKAANDTAQNYAPSQQAQQNQQASPSSNGLDGFMDIPDGIDEALPFT